MTTVSGVGVLDKALQIVAAVAERPRSLNELAELDGFSRATAHRLAQALEDHGLLARDRVGLWALGPGWLRWAAGAGVSPALADRARPVIAALRDETGESAQLFVRDGAGRRCVVAAESPHELRTIVEEGAVLALGVGSAGRLLNGTPAGPTGWLQSVGERRAGVVSVSAPVCLGSEVVAAVSVSGPIDRLGAQPGRRHGTAVVAAARQLAALLS
jgi:DNA-binding IclR family transcriptional regulator